MSITVLVFIGYMGLMASVGFISRRYTKGIEGFTLGDRSMGPWLTALSYESTAFSGWLMLGLPGRAFRYGLAAIWVCIACLLGDALNWKLTLRRLRHETDRLKALTIPTYLERRFYKPGGLAIQSVAALAISVFMLIYLWSQFVASGKVIMAMLGWNYPWAVLASSTIIMLYTMQGGYRAVVWTDAIQAVLMVIALIVLPIACFIHLGGWSDFTSALSRASSQASQIPSLSATSSNLSSWFAGMGGLALFSFFFEDAGMGLGYLGQPHTCVRFMGIDSERDLRPAFIVSMVFVVLVCTGGVLVGLVAHGWYHFVDPANPSAVISAEGISAGSVPIDISKQGHELILPNLTMRIMPEWMSGLVVSAIMAAIMSTASGFLLSVTSSLTEDVYHAWIHPQASEKQLVFVSRAVTVGLGLGAMTLSLLTDPKDPNSTVYRLVLYGWGGLAGAFSAPVTLSLLYPRMTRAGCLAGIIVGSLLVFVWGAIPGLSDTVNEIIPSIALSALTIFFVSAVTTPPAPDAAGMPHD